jgi:hypothetical protein
VLGSHASFIDPISPELQPPPLYSTYQSKEIGFQAKVISTPQRKTLLEYMLSKPCAHQKVDKSFAFC